MNIIPKCTCWEGEGPNGEDYLNEVGAQVMSYVGQAILAYPVCEEAMPYFLATICAGVLMAQGLHNECRRKQEAGLSEDTPINVAPVREQALKIMKLIPTAIEQRGDIYTRNRYGSQS